MPGRLQLFNEPGELAKIGQVWFVESVTEGHTGRRLRESLEDLLATTSRRIKVVFRTPRNRAELLAVLEELRVDVLASRLNPILDIECHGSDDRSGLIAAGGEYISWEELKPALEAINLATRVNLVLVLGCCYGAYFGQVSRLDERAAFSAYIAPTSLVGMGMLEDGLRAFYAELFTSLDITRALDALRVAAPGMGYFYASAVGLFRSVLAEYIRDFSTGEGLRRRARALARRMRDDGSRRRPGPGAVARVLKAREPNDFARMRRTHFATDLFPENEGRFGFTYADIRRDAERLAKRKRSPRASR
jgi:hypothetical protein